MMARAWGKFGWPRCWCSSAGARAQRFNLWRVNEVYSNADGTIQFVEFSTTFSSQQFVNNQTISGTNGTLTNSFTMTMNLQGDSANLQISGRHRWICSAWNCHA